VQSSNLRKLHLAPASGLTVLTDTTTKLNCDRKLGTRSHIPQFRVIMPM
jgi:hypothetical protein